MHLNLKHLQESGFIKQSYTTEIGYDQYERSFDDSTGIVFIVRILSKQTDPFYDYKVFGLFKIKNEKKYFDIPFPYSKEVNYHNILHYYDSFWHNLDVEYLALLELPQEEVTLNSESKD